MGDQVGVVHVRTERRKAVGCSTLPLPMPPVRPTRKACSRRTAEAEVTPRVATAQFAGEVAYDVSRPAGWIRCVSLLRCDTRANPFAPSRRPSICRRGLGLEDPKRNGMVRTIVLEDIQVLVAQRP